MIEKICRNSVFSIILKSVDSVLCQENSAWRALKRESVAGVNFDMEAMTRSSGFSFMSPLLE